KPGDFIVADDDGVVVVKRSEVKSVIQRAEERIKKEEATRRKIQNGELSIDFYNLRPVLQENGVIYR
ncbi:MAG: 4-carboxy-4-hydroxy-2-oxoadipate aldolase/oxaloacetate decarboxylase, partial [Thermoplasmataceae archaeon]